jgi:hypothetical protein
MSLVQDHHVIQAFTADTPDQPLDIRILPRTSGGNQHIRHEKEIKSDQVRDVVIEEDLPRWRRWRAWFHPVGLDGRFGHINAQLAQLAHKSGRAPGRVRLPHRLDEFADLLGNRRATGGSLPTQAPPIVTKALLLPGDHCAGLDECQDIEPAWPEPRRREA